MLARSSHGVQRGSATKQHTRKNHVSLSSFRPSLWRHTMSTLLLFFPFFFSFFCVSTLSLSPFNQPQTVLSSLTRCRAAAKREQRERAYPRICLEVRSSCDQSFMFQWILPTDSSPRTTIRPCSRKLFLVRLKFSILFGFVPTISLS